MRERVGSKPGRHDARVRATGQTQCGYGRTLSLPTFVPFLFLRRSLASLYVKLSAGRGDPRLVGVVPLSEDRSIHTCGCRLGVSD
jgi:hypothetical protein